LAGHVLRLPDVRPAHVAMTWPKNQRSTTDDLAEVYTEWTLAWTWCKESCQRSTPVEKSRRPVSRPGQEEINL